MRYAAETGHYTYTSVDTRHILHSLAKLRDYCEDEDFKGYDPYDGLNSRVARALLPLRHSAFLRLCVIQGFKRCPVNLRPLALVPKEHNAKGVALFLSGYCRLYRVLERHPEWQLALGPRWRVADRIGQLADLLLSMRSEGNWHGACWGYNFDWQARRLFLFPKHTPTVVATCFCATALAEAYEVAGGREWLDAALSAADFVACDLHRTPCPGGFLFSYSPLEGNDTVYNASLLGSRILALAYRYTRREGYRDLARQSVAACCEGQRGDGAWVYGLLPVQGWVDSFHTGYNLEALAAYEEMAGDASFHNHLERGFDYYIRHFFCEDGTPKYYDNRTYPIDIHCPGQLLVTLARLGRTGDYAALAGNVLDWTLRNMQAPVGYFYYQLKPHFSSKIPYMRWSNAFMFYAMAHYLDSL